MPRFKYQSHFVDGNGSVVVDGTVTVSLTGTGTAATIYAAESGGSALSGGQTTSDSTDGSFSFWVDTGDYGLTQEFRIVLSKTNYSTRTYDDIKIFPYDVDAVDYTELRAFAIPANGTKKPVSYRSAIGDGGGGEFVFNTSDLSASVTADTLSGIYVAPNSDPTGASGAWVRDFTSTINVAWWGAALDGDADDSGELQAAEAFLRARFGGRITWSGEMGIANTVKFAPNISLESFGVGNKIIPVSGGTFDNGFMFYFNTDDGVTPIAESPMKIMGTIKGFEVDNRVNDVANCRFCLKHGGYKFIDVMLSGMSQFVSKMSYYGDFNYVEHCHYRQPQDASTYYAIDFGPGLGDGVWINQVDFPEFSGSETKGLRINQAIGGTVTNLLNGDNILENCKAIEWNSDHTEGGHLTIDRSSVNFNGGAHWNEADSTCPIVLQDSGSNTLARHKVVFNNKCFIVSPGLGGDPGSADIKTHPNFDIEIRNCFRLLTQTGHIDESRIMGIEIEDEAGSPISDFNDYSHITSRESRINFEKVVFSGRIDNYSGGVFSGLGSPSASNKFIFSATSTTYYYAAQILLDPIRKIGREGTNTQSYAATNGGDAPLFTFSFGQYSRVSVVRLYRGTSAGSYDQYVDIPLVSCSSFIDTGTHVNGFAWKSRASAGTDSLNTGYDESAVISSGTSIFEVIGSIPSNGEFKQGDVLRKIDGTIDANDMLLTGAQRLTSGSGHVSGTDWAKLYISHVSPAT